MWKYLDLCAQTAQPHCPQNLCHIAHETHFPIPPNEKETWPIALLIYMRLSSVVDEPNRELCGD